MPGRRFNCLGQNFLLISKALFEKSQVQTVEGAKKVVLNFHGPLQISSFIFPLGYFD